MLRCIISYTFSSTNCILCHNKKTKNKSSSIPTNPYTTPRTHSSLPNPQLFFPIHRYTFPIFISGPISPIKLCNMAPPRRGWAPPTAMAVINAGVHLALPTLRRAERKMSAHSTSVTWRHVVNMAVSLTGYFRSYFVKSSFLVICWLCTWERTTRIIWRIW